MSRKKNTKESRRIAVKKAGDARQLVIQLQNDPVAMRQAKRLIAAI